MGSISIKFAFICSVCKRDVPGFVKQAEVDDSPKHAKYPLVHSYNHDKCKGETIIVMIRKIEGKFNLKQQHKLANEVIRREYALRQLNVITTCPCGGLPIHTTIESHDENYDTGVDTYVFSVIHGTHYGHGALNTLIERLTST